jgi:hypothetical protein
MTHYDYGEQRAYSWSTRASYSAKEIGRIRSKTRRASAAAADALPMPDAGITRTSTCRLEDCEEFGKRPRIRQLGLGD